MRRSFFAPTSAGLFCLCLLYACAKTGAPPAPDDLAGIPDGGAFEDEPLDAKSAAAQRNLAEVGDLGLEFEAIAISNPAELEAAGLAADGESAPFLAPLLAALAEGVGDADYVLTFDPTATIFPLIRNADGAPLIAVSRVDRDIPTCTTRVSTALEDGEDAVGYGARAGTLTQGICGAIAAAHSFLALNLVPRDKLVDGGNFKERPLKKIQGRNRKQMTKKRLQKLHEAAGATVCRAGAGDFRTNNLGALRNFNRTLSGFVNDPAHDWDCTLFVRTRKGGKDVLAHFEHVTGVSLAADGGASITTTNGLDQGNQKDTVPVDPGTNSWASQPGGDPPFKLTQCTGRDGANTVKSTPNAGLVNYLCCRKP